MTTASTTLLGLALPVTGELSGTWGDVVNASLTNLLDTAIAGTTTLSSDADVTLSTTTLSANQARQAVILWTAGGTATRTITAPAQSKSYVIINATSSSQSIKLVGVGPTTGITIVAGEKCFAAWNGSDFVKVGNTSGAGVFSTVTASSLTSGRVTYAGTAGLLQDSANLTFNGTTLTANTIGAFTLGGTVAGGGNQLNNVIIGTTTPLAGAFTTVTATGTGTFSGTLKGTANVWSEGAGSDTAAAGNLFMLSNGAGGGSARYWATQQSSSGAAKVDYYFNGTSWAQISSVSSTGLAVTGTLSATGTISSTATSGNLFSGTSGVTTGHGLYLDLGLQTSGHVAYIYGNSPSHTGSILRVYQDSATAGMDHPFWVHSDGTKIAHFESGSGTVADISSTGLAVTGTLSATGSNISMTVNSSGAGEGAYKVTNGATFIGALAAAGWFHGNASQNFGIQAANSIEFATNNSATTSMTLDSSGNLGLGVTPSAWTSFKALQIGAYAGLAGFTNEFDVCCNAYYGSGWKYLNTAAASQYQQAAGSHAWYNAPSGTAGNAITFTQAMTLDASGNLVVGATSSIGNGPAITVKCLAAGQQCYTSWNATTSGNPYFHEFGTEGTYTARGSITYNRAGGLTVYNTTSDYRLKEHIIDLPNALETVSRLKPRQFDWKETGNTTTGFIAHELAEVCPHAVTGEKDAVEMQQYEISPAVPATQDEEGNEVTAAVEAVMGEREVPRYQGIDTSFLVATLTAAIQEQQAIIAALTTRITALENK